MNASTAYLVYKYEVQREAEYIDANKVAPLWKYDQHCRKAGDAKLVDLPRFCAITGRVSLIQARKVVFEVE